MTIAVADRDVDPLAPLIALPAQELSEREREVLLMVAEGLPNKLIARRLEISEKTVKAHLTSVFRTIGVTDRTQAGVHLMGRLQRLFNRAELDENEVNILRGLLTAIQGKRRTAGGRDRSEVRS